MLEQKQAVQAGGEDEGAVSAENAALREERAA